VAGWSDVARRWRVTHGSTSQRPLAAGLTKVTVMRSRRSLAAGLHGRQLSAKGTHNANRICELDCSANGDSRVACSSVKPASGLLRTTGQRVLCVVQHWPRAASRCQAPRESGRSSSYCESCSVRHSANHERRPCGARRLGRMQLLLATVLSLPLVAHQRSRRAG
jgi:hypothetical protein